jgi:esterase/lipase
MKIENIVLTAKGINTPAIKITSSDVSPDVIIMHGYGGSKEEQLGLSWRIANFGFNTYVIDMRGHGENTLPLSHEILNDLDNLINEIRRPSVPVITVGHSLGGRIALLSKADYRIGLSPALSQSFSEQTQTITKNLRQHRVIQDNPNINFEILKKLPPVDLRNNDLIIYGSRDVADIIQECVNLSKGNNNVVKIENAMHGETFILEKTFSIIKTFLSKIKLGRTT